MKHGRDCPDRCSQCLGAAVHRVDQIGDVLWVDGKPARTIANEKSSREYYRRRRRG